MKENMTYTEAADRLEAIVSRIEHESPDVDELTKLVEEAIDLTRFCRDKLTKADKQLEELMAKLDEEEQES
ncbi:exodeoxyribonuclease VII small subunit [Porphyromonas pogonae]|uniref:exodeoxyribonuclease VII small subunit n=1 Tax=Porphyromonas pogonae TaxID=867595 RepID=UPI002E781FDA|nr:exodeoxyribonuclease VII small subunit [Porphyromonas pogonae]